MDDAERGSWASAESALLAPWRKRVAALEAERIANLEKMRAFSDEMREAITSLGSALEEANERIAASIEEKIVAPLRADRDAAKAENAKLWAVVEAARDKVAARDGATPRHRPRGVEVGGRGTRGRQVAEGAMKTLTLVRILGAAYVLDLAKEINTIDRAIVEPEAIDEMVAHLSMLVGFDCRVKGDQRERA